MNTLLVAVDLNPGRNQPQLQALLEQFDSMRFSESTFAVNSECSAQELFERLQPLLGPDDTAYVITLDRPWYGYGYEAMNDWLQRHLG